MAGRSAADPSREAAGQRSEGTEQGVEFALTTGDLGLDSPEERYLSRLTLRLDAACRSRVTVEVSYDAALGERRRPDSGGPAPQL